mmetsp:Transcript_5924/g.24462  ORF Transcript_5924/g.24462 Transcript_5924/m.24462 type:complete len:434 (+) Transcript_5924:587-1888(+)
MADGRRVRRAHRENVRLASRHAPRFSGVRRPRPPGPSPGGREGQAEGRGVLARPPRRVARRAAGRRNPRAGGGGRRRSRRSEATADRDGPGGGASDRAGGIPSDGPRGWKFRRRVGRGVGRPVFGQGHGEVPVEVLRRLPSVPRAIASAPARAPVRRDDGVDQGSVPRGYPAVLRLLRGDRRDVRDRRRGRAAAAAAAADRRGSRKRSDGQTEIRTRPEGEGENEHREHRRRPGLGRGLARRGQGRGVGRRAERRLERVGRCAFLLQRQAVQEGSKGGEGYRVPRRGLTAELVEVRGSGDDAGAGVVARAGRARRGRVQDGRRRRRFHTERQASGGGRLAGQEQGTHGGGAAGAGGRARAGDSGAGGGHGTAGDGGSLVRRARDGGGDGAGAGARGGRGGGGGAREKGGGFELARRRPRVTELSLDALLLLDN